MVAPRESQVEERTNSLWIGDLPTTWDENTLTEHLKGDKLQLVKDKYMVCHIE